MNKYQAEFGHRGMERPLRYVVRNRITGRSYTFKTSAGASRAMDRMDSEYGAVICSRQAIWSDDADTRSTYGVGAMA